MTIDLTICELENLLMKCSFCERHHGHEYAVSAVRKLSKARNEYLKAFGEQRSLIDTGAEMDEAMEMGLDFTLTK
jgi:hypothetical protein